MAGIDKVTRILMMYSRLLEGGKIYKKTFCEDMGINRRTFDRDIEDVRLFLSEAYVGYDLIYDRQDESYHLENYHQQIPLSPMEVSFLMIMTKSEQILRKDEYTQLVSNIIRTGTWNKQEMLTKISLNDIDTYPQQGKKEALLKMQWDLQQCINERDVIRILLSDKNQKVVSPLALWILDGELYLIGYGAAKKTEAVLVREIEFFRMEQKKFSKEIAEQFKDMNWRKIIQAQKEERKKTKDGTTEKEN